MSGLVKLEAYIKQSRENINALNLSPEQSKILENAIKRPVIVFIVSGKYLKEKYLLALPHGIFMNLMPSRRSMSAS